jgi:formate dehydrogenase major subunit
MTNSIEEVKDADVIFITGTNTTENHPVIGAMVKQAINNGTKIIVADPREIELSKYAEVHLQLKPGTNIALFNGMMNVIINEKLEDEEFIKERTENFEEMKKAVMKYPPEKAAEICGVDAEDIRKAARLYAKADSGSILYAMGVTQHSSGTNQVMSTANLAMLCGNMGKEGTGVNPLRGQNNVQGACDMGALPGDLPGYQKINKPEVIEKFNNAWGVKLSTNPGLTVPEMIIKAHEGHVKLMYIMGENPMVSDPDTNHVRESLGNLDFLIVQDIFLTETAELADLVLPASTFAEKDGTFTNTERRIQRVRKAIEPVGESKPDWVILMEIMNKLGYNKTYNNPMEIMEEIASVTPSYGGIDYERIEEEGIQWPCPSKDHPGTKFLHKGKFSRGKGLFNAIEYTPSVELADDEYPLVLTTGRILYQYHTRTMTDKSEGLTKIAPESYIEMNPKLAAELKIEDGEKVKVSSRRGEIFTKAKVTDTITNNVVFIPFHYAEGAANVLTNADSLDKKAKIPELKVCAVKVDKIS